jgi:hypothetical protein
MIWKIKKILRTVAGGIIPALSLSLVMSSVAWALSGSTNISLSNGTISITGTIPVENGGTGLASIPDDSIWIGTGADTNTVVAGVAINNCTGGSSALTYATASNSFSCLTGISQEAYPVLTFTSETKIDLADNTTPVYMGLGGRVSSTEGDVAVPISAGSFTNLYCRASGTLNGSNGVTVTVRIGDCGSEADTAATLDVINISSATPYTGSAVTATAGQCMTLSMVRKTSGDPTAYFINCTLAKTLN